MKGNPRKLAALCLTAAVLLPGLSGAAHGADQLPNDNHCDTRDYCMMAHDVSLPLSEYESWAAGGGLEGAILEAASPWLRLRVEDETPWEDWPLADEYEVDLSGLGDGPSDGGYPVTITLPPRRERGEPSSITFLVYVVEDLPHEGPPGYDHHMDTEDICLSYNDCAAQAGQVAAWLDEGRVEAELKQAVTFRVSALQSGDDLSGEASLERAEAEELRAEPGAYPISLLFQIRGQPVEGPALLTVTADPKPEPPPGPAAGPEPSDSYYRVVVRYVEESSGTKLAPDYRIDRIREGKKYDVSAQTGLRIEGYRQISVEGAVSGYLGRDVTVTVYFEAVPRPVPVPAATPAPETPPPTIAPEPSQMPEPEPAGTPEPTPAPESTAPVEPERSLPPSRPPVSPPSQAAPTVPKPSPAPATPPDTASIPLPTTPEPVSTPEPEESSAPVVGFGGQGGDRPPPTGGAGGYDRGGSMLTAAIVTADLLLGGALLVGIVSDLRVLNWYAKKKRSGSSCRLPR